MSTPTTTNKTADTVNSIIKGIENIAVPMIEAALIAKFPLLGAPVVKQITEEVEQVLANYVATYAEQGADFLVIDAQVDSEESKLENAQKEGASDAAFQAAQSALVNDDGSGQLQ